MGKFLLFLLIAAAAIVALKVALLACCLICLIFKPKETVSVLLVLGMLALIRNYTVACIFVGVVLVGVSIYQHRRST